MAEVGCFSGVSTCIFAEFAKTVWAVDPWEDACVAGYKEISEEMIRQAHLRFYGRTRSYKNIVPIRDFSISAAKATAERSLDAVYIDADHSRFPEDARAWLPILKDSGLFMGHDYGQVRRHFSELGIDGPVIVYQEDSFVVPVSRIRRNI
jgi:predicted O-methyltransferase YrrM